MKKPKPLDTFAGLPVYKASDVVGIPSHIRLALQLFHGQAEGAIPNGTVVEKCNTETSDSFKDGHLGVVLSSLAVPELDGYAYYIQFQGFDGPVLISSKRVREHEPH